MLWAPLDVPGAARPTLALWFDERGWRCPTEAQHAIGAPFPLGRLPVAWRIVTLIALDGAFWDRARRASRRLPRPRADSAAARRASSRGRERRTAPGLRSAAAASIRGIPASCPRDPIGSRVDDSRCRVAASVGRQQILSRLMAGKLAASPPPGAARASPPMKREASPPLKRENPTPGLDFSGCPPCQLTVFDETASWAISMPYERRVCEIISGFVRLAFELISEFVRPDCSHFLGLSMDHESADQNAWATARQREHVLSQLPARPSRAAIRDAMEELGTSRATLFRGCGGSARAVEPARFCRARPDQGWVLSRLIRRCWRLSSGISSSFTQQDANRR